eukprot:CAMPEP_0196716912 /NCGR_PEP_ID=MMETSP1091-20130531/337_1 /TAXON_ID=302021 /ORGANISM="Rhodomonas sp., Strain CCMP768" /LENGTH=159 /DNA_ID=CAMNT_0042057103 /DNA_START=241 /DNA_END=720 /DNA_ORIENTATION=+
MPASNEVTAGKTYLELIQSGCPSKSTPEAPKQKTKRERADDNWKLLDDIIKESEQYEKGSDQRAKCLERLHEMLRTISKRPPQIASPHKKLRKEYSSAREEWDDFLAPSCSICDQDEATCHCDELAANADSFLADGDVVDKDEMESTEAGSPSQGQTSP